MGVSDTEREVVETLISIELAAKILDLSHWGVRYRVKRGLLNAVRRKRKLFFEATELLRSLEVRKKVRRVESEAAVEKSLPKQKAPEGLSVTGTLRNGVREVVDEKTT